MSTIALYGENGSKRQAVIVQSRNDVSHMQGIGSMPGMAMARLIDGTPLNFVDETTFKNVLTGELLSRVPPKR
ncbi:MAG: hypothetical protein WB729_11205 [Candidatus Sulfotelmatobacter sp.]